MWYAILWFKVLMGLAAFMFVCTLIGSLSRYNPRWLEAIATKEIKLW